MHGKVPILLSEMIQGSIEELLQPSKEQGYSLWSRGSVVYKTIQQVIKSFDANQ